MRDGSRQRQWTLAASLFGVSLTCVGAVAVAQAQRRPVVVTSEDRRPLVPGLRCGAIRVLVQSEDTAGAFSVVEGVQRDYLASGMLDVHTHTNMDGAYYVVEGRLGVHIDGKTQVLGPGAYMFVPEVCRTRKGIRAGRRTRC